MPHIIYILLNSAVRSKFSAAGSVHHCHVHTDSDHAAYRAFGHLPAVRAFRHSRYLLSVRIHFPRIGTDHGLCRRYRGALCISILLTSGEGDRAAHLKRSKFLAGLVTTIIGAILVLFITLTHKFVPTSDPEPVEISIKTIGHALLSSGKYGYVLPFEAVSILLLACIVGGLLIARKR